MGSCQWVERCLDKSASFSAQQLNSSLLCPSLPLCSLCLGHKHMLSPSPSQPYDSSINSYISVLRCRLPTDSFRHVPVAAQGPGVWMQSMLCSYLNRITKETWFGPWDPNGTGQAVRQQYSLLKMKWNSHSKSKKAFRISFTVQHILGVFKELTSFRQYSSCTSQDPSIKRVPFK